MFSSVTARLAAIIPGMGGESFVREHILFLLPIPEPKDILDKLRKKHPNVTIVYRCIYFHQGTFKYSEKIPDELYKDVTILCTLSAMPQRVESAPKLKLIHFISSGTDHISKHPIYTDTDIPMTTGSGVASPMIAEWVLLQILSQSHKQKILYEGQKRHEWTNNKEMNDRSDRVGLRLAILGYGSIGRHAARVCKAMGMDVIAYTASPRPTLESKRDQGYIVPGTGDPDGTIPTAWYSGMDKASLHDFLSQDIDVLLVAVPMTKQTIHFLAAPEFEILGTKKNAFIVNISRGSIVNQADLITYLKKSPEEGGLQGAALDVTDPEPLPKGHEMWDMENVTITPHVASLCSAYGDRALEVFDINLTNLEKGRPLINLVDKKKGY